MKSSLIIVASLIAVSIISCKKETPDNAQVKSEPKDQFKVSLDIVAKQNDSLQLFYTEDNSLAWAEDKSVWATVKGSEAQQHVEFDLPADVYPGNLRLDFGTNKNQTEISVKKFEMDYAGKKFEVKDNLFFQYFIPVNQVEWDNQNSVAKIVTPPGASHDPSFNPREILTQEIVNLSK